MQPTATLDSRGILRPTAAAAAFTLRRHAPSANLSDCVERYWVVEWDLPENTTHVQEVIGYPCVDLVFEPGTARVWGPQSGRMRRCFEGRGRALGVKFRPGGFLPFAACEPSQLVNRSMAVVLALRGAHADDVSELSEQVARTKDEPALLSRVDDWLGGLRPERSRMSWLVNKAIASALHDPKVATVEQLAFANAVSVRTLQRVFRAHIGISPKAVLNRFRLMAAVHAADSCNVRSWAETAADLGYADQAHLARDFRSRLGVTPGTYVADRLAASGERTSTSQR